MKKIYALAGIAVLAAFIVVFTVPAAGAGDLSLSEQYFIKFPLKVLELEKTWGSPVAVQKFDNGMEKRIYRIRNPYPEALAYRYFVVADGRVISSGITDTAKVESHAKDGGTIRFPVSRLSKAYYSRHPLSAEKVKEVWGKPVVVYQAEGGLENWVYKIANPYPRSAAYRYFLISSGSVLASGMTDTAGIVVKTKHGGEPAGDWSRKYFQKFPRTVAEIENRWGKPVAVQEYDNGMEKQVYRIPHPFPENLKYRYFLVQDGSILASGISESIACDDGLN